MTAAGEPTGTKEATRGKSGTDGKKRVRHENFAFVFGASPGKFVLANTSMVKDVIAVFHARKSPN